MRFEAGARFGDLVIERELGHGAFAVVYLARDTFLDRPVALKVLAVASLSGSEEDRARLLDEARTVAQLRSPHIVPLHRVHDLGPGGLALEMEYMEGGSLADLLELRPTLPPEEAIALTRNVLAALEEAHAHGVLHCDVKPENVLLTARGEARLADFGLGRRISEASLSEAHAAKIQGTPLYMSPEVVGGERPTPASDLWSVGVLLYRMLSGRLPFAARSLPALFYAIHHEPPEPLGEGHPASLAALIARCLKKEPAQRPVSAAAILEEFAGGSGGERRPPRVVPVADVPAGPAPLGRDAEIVTLTGILAAAQEARGGAGLLLGEAGIGKSTLLREAARTARERGFRWLEATITPVGGVQRPLLGAARRLLLGESASGLAGQITSTRFGGAATLLRSLLTEDAFELQGRQQFVWAVEHLLRGLAAERPVALALEDLHFADGEDLRSLAEVVRRVADARVAILATARTNDPSSSQGLTSSAPAMQELTTVPRLVTIAVGALSDETLHRLVLRESGAERAAPEVLERIREQSEGNALFALELVRHLMADHALEVHGARLKPGPRWNDTELPQRLADLVSVRLQRLTPDQRELLDAAAVDGVSFDGAVLTAVMGGNLLKTLRDLQRITREHGLLVPLKQGFRFTHAMFRDVIYRELSPDLRRTYHRALAEHLEAAGAGRADPERLGLHWHHAGEPANAAPHLRAAALAAAKRQDYARALRLADQGGVRANEVDAGAIANTADLRFALAGCLSDLGRAREADEIVHAVRVAAEQQGERALELRARVRANSHALVTGGVARLEPAMLEQAVAELTTSFESARAAYLLGYYHRTAGDDTQAEHWLSKADALFAEAGLTHMRGQVLHLLGVVAERRGKREEARVRFELAAKVKSDCGRPMDAAISRIMASVMDFQQGRLEGTAVALERSIDEVRVAGAEERAAHASVYLAQVQSSLGQFEEAERVLQGAVSVLSENRLLYGRMEALSTLGDVQTSLARYESAHASLREAKQLAIRGQDPSARALACGLTSRAFALAGQTAEARSALTEAMDSFETISTEARESLALLVALACYYDRQLSRELCASMETLERLFAPFPGHASTLLWNSCVALLSDSPSSTHRVALEALMLNNPPGPRRHELLSVSAALESREAECA